MVYVRVAVLPVESVALTVNVLVCTVVGVPTIARVRALACVSPPYGSKRLRPAGSAPAMIWKSTGPTASGRSVIDAPRLALALKSEPT
jgi:hypothetical protein